MIENSSRQEIMEMKKRLSFKSIKAKVLFGFSIVVVLVLGLGVYSLLSANTVNKRTQDIIDKEVQLLIANERLVASVSDRVSATRAFFIDGEEKFIDRFNQYNENGKEYAAVVQELNHTEEFSALATKTDDWADFISQNIFEEYKRGNKETAKENMGQMLIIAQELQTSYLELAQNGEASINQQGQSIISSGKTTIVITTVIVILSLVLSIIIGLFTANTIAKPIRLVMLRMKSIAEGDLSNERLLIHSRDEVGQLVDATNDMNDSMRDMIRKMNTVSEAVSSQSEELTQVAGEVKAGTEQVAITMVELATGSETQANNASDLAGNMGSLTEMVDEANDSGEKIQTNSEKVLQLTTNGSQLMNASTEQMVKINHIVKEAVTKVQDLDNQSKRISQLVTVIKDVADQTNLLALNAAIEAARAGEHGKGFAVVADEVRKLAEQVALSVSDITEIVTDIQTESSSVAESLTIGYKEVEHGTTEIEATGKTFNEISEALIEMVDNIKVVSTNLAKTAVSCQDMNESIEEIAALSEESAAGVEQVTASSQQASSSMEEVAGSSEHLAELAEELNRMVGQFKL